MLGVGIAVGLGGMGGAPRGGITSLDQIAGLYLSLLSGVGETTEGTAGTVSTDLSTWTQSNATFGASAVPASITESTDADGTIVHRAYANASGLGVGALTCHRMRFSSLDDARYITARNAGTAAIAVYDTDTGGITTTSGANLVAAEIDQDGRTVEVRTFWTAVAANDIVAAWFRDDPLNDNTYQGDGRVIATFVENMVTQARLSGWENPAALSGPDAAQGTPANMPLRIPDFQHGLSAYRFDGTDDRWDFASDPIGSTTAFTIAHIFRATDTSSGTIESSDNGPKWSLVNQRLRVTFPGGAYGEIVFADTRGVHIPITQYDGSQSTNATRLRIWVDGVEWPMTYSGTIPASFAAPTSGRIGDNQTPDDPLAAYWIDRVGYDRAIGATQVGWLATFLASRCGLRRFYSRKIVIIEGQSNGVGGAIDTDLGALPYLYTAGGSDVRSWQSCAVRSNGGHGMEFGLCSALAARGIQPIIIKYAVNGSGLDATVASDDWLPSEAESYAAADTFVQARLAELNASASELALVWWQGENDSNVESKANNYAANLTTISAAWRSDLSAPSLPIIGMKLNPDADNGAYEGTVEAAFDTWGAADPTKNKVFSCQSLGYPSNDGIHYGPEQQEAGGEATAALL